MRVDERPAPERFRYCDLKEALGRVHLMEIQSGVKQGARSAAGEVSHFCKKMASAWKLCTLAS